MNPIKSATILTVACLAALASAPALAQKTPAPGATPPAVKGPRVEAGIIQEITEQLASADPTVRKQGIDAVRARVTSAPRPMSELKTYWFKPLLAARAYDEVVEFANLGILSAPGDTRSVEAALLVRIKAHLGQGKSVDALQSAKSLYNVSGMAATSEAILSVAECLNAAFPEDKDIFNRFRDEQVAGATTQPTTRPGERVAGKPSTVLAGIKVDARLYEPALRATTGEDAASLLARGNLLLMMDRPKDARVLFERMYSLVGADLTEASEALARCIKAEDGTIGAANTWIYSIRPRK